MIPPATRRRALLAAILMAGTACASPSGVAPSVRPEIVWPAPPETPRVRLLSTISDPATPDSARSWWRRALAWITGASPEDEDQRFARPFGVVMGPQGDIFVADPDAGSVIRIGAGDEGRELACTGMPWSSPMAVALDDSGGLWVADGAAAAVIRWSPSGCRSIGTGVLDRPTGIAISGGRIWVADPPRHRITVFEAGGEVVAQVGERGAGDGQFDYPVSIARGPADSLLVVDSLNFRIAKLSKAANWIGAFGHAGEAGDGLARPKAVTVDGSGRIFVSDAQRDVVLVFRADGVLDFTVGASGAGPGHFAHPAGLAVHGDRLVVADSQNRRVQVFEILGE